MNKLKDKVMCVVWLDKLEVDLIDKFDLDSQNMDDNLMQVGDIIINASKNGRFRHTK